jgi:hypothetical protein
MADNIRDLQIVVYVGHDELTATVEVEEDQGIWIEFHDSDEEVEPVFMDPEAARKLARELIAGAELAEERLGSW